MKKNRLKRPPSERNARHPRDCRERTYRRQVAIEGLHAFQAVSQETDLMILADRPLEAEARETMLACRAHIEEYIKRYPGLATTLKPWPAADFAPPIVRRMVEAGRAAGVGPMAAVAGAVAEHVGRSLLEHCSQVVVENGGDIFLKTETPIVASLFAGSSPLSMKVGLLIQPPENGAGVCTSSGTVGHSYSKGAADAVCVISSSCPLADAAATAIGNRIRSATDIKAAIDFGKTIPQVMGIVAVVDREIGAWGQVELVPTGGKKG